MSRSVGASLNDRLWTLLNGVDLALKLGKAFLIATADPAGMPHPALLSYGEVVPLTGRASAWRCTRGADQWRISGPTGESR